MPKILKNASLKPYNTFGLEAAAAFLTTISSVEDLSELVNLPDFEEKQSLVLGGGSNLLLTQDFDGMVIKNEIKGIHSINETDEHIWLKVGGGEVWHDFVMYCVNQGYGGVENLSLIPGTVGAAPMQNIGAYGIEIKDVFDSLEAFNWQTGAIETFDNPTCGFGYRESIFKHSHKGKYFIVNVTFKLKKRPELNIEYGAIQTTLADMGITNPTIKDVSRAVITIRQSKLPDPKEIGNSGSFFKNPVISKALFIKIQEKYDNVPSYPIDDENVKIPAGWMIEKAGWKGYRRGDIGVHKNQALVLVNYGNGSGLEIKKLSEEIIASVFENFGVNLQPEVNII
ncbi:UDP-N-acetylmuramate dehydrogenase [Jiulongibacter sediminis]|uniref:UDP-N-acetylenolpyruvoylglucosamine reductase n=1 Tax=Jiulongibacter sediminis TaxID=1605367 RepID=A0A0P7C5U4_9BACT|nr:UDP-N-acetylmuramate dehydrogenase [Jiulongibacter sediminis]KPM48702.1 UDP-N-acetylenolpyruvoylglucosamine reductase [Jiulongibacter sediminis]TBX25237.1 UDP-N-acetylenolpyruvoylglucosamine reductase [Jiulongibacter sediminis]